MSNIIEPDSLKNQGSGESPPPPPPTKRFSGKAIDVTRKVVSRVQEMASRFADLLVAAFAVAAGAAWKDSVFWLFSPKGPLGFLKYNTITLAIAITAAGALLTMIRTYLPLTPKSETFRNEVDDELFMYAH
jgi:hypothetical protein